MVSQLPADQLFDLCAGYGATTQRIREHAPFMEALPVTQDALQVLAERGVYLWEHAARAVLICVVKFNGADAFTKKDAHFVDSCLGLSSPTVSMTQRLNDLVNEDKFRYATSPTTLANRRRDAMAHLANVLAVLDAYPCSAERRIKQAVDEAAAHVELVRSRRLAHLNEKERDEFYLKLFEKLEGATAVFEQYDPSLSLDERFEIMVEAVAAGAYSRWYETGSIDDVNRLLKPEQVPYLYLGTSPDKGPAINPGSAMAEHTARRMALLMQDIEQRGIWEQTLIAGIGAEAEVVFVDQ